MVYKVTQNITPTIDFLLCVADSLNENRINIISDFLNNKHWTVRTFIVDLNDENNKYFDFIIKNGAPDIVVALDSAILIQKAKEASKRLEKDYLIAMYLTQERLPEGNYDGADLFFIEKRNCADELLNIDGEKVIYLVDKGYIHDLYVKLYASANGRILRRFQYCIGKEEEVFIKDKISVIIPCYNVEKYIARCLDSVISQTIGIDNIEIIAVNDASPDGTLDILYQYEKEYPDLIAIINLDENVGLGQARNIGMSYASGEYITFIDSDDFIARCMLEVLYLSMLCYPADYVDCEFVGVVTDVPDIEYRGKKVHLLRTIDNIEDRRDLFYENAMQNSACMRLFSKNFIAGENPISFPARIKMEDILFFYKVLASAKVVYHVPEMFYYYFMNLEGTMLSGGFHKYYMDIQKSFGMAIAEYKRIGLFDELKEELSAIWLRKVLLHIFEYEKRELGEIKKEDAENLIAYLTDTFGDITANKYIKDDEKEILKSYGVWS